MKKRQRARLQLRILGQELEINFDVPEGTMRPQDALPAAYAIIDAVAGVAQEGSVAAGRAVSCRRGCAACCRQMVTLSAVEAVGMADLVAALPAEKQIEVRTRFARAIERVRAGGLVAAGSPDDAPVMRAPQAKRAGEAFDRLLDAYFGLGIACPFLENEECGIYEARPAICREYLITSPAENCSAVGKKETAGVPLPVYMSDKLVDFGQRGKGRKQKIPLVFALAWAQTHRHQMDGEAEPRRILSELVTLLDNEALVPYEERRCGSGEAGI